MLTQLHVYMYLLPTSPRNLSESTLEAPDQMTSNS